MTVEHFYELVGPRDANGLPVTMKEFRRRTILKTLEVYRGDAVAASAALGVHYTTVQTYWRAERARALREGRA